MAQNACVHASRLMQTDRLKLPHDQAVQVRHRACHRTTYYIIYTIHIIYAYDIQ